MRSTVVQLGGASLHVEQSIWRGDEELVSLVVRLVCIHIEGRATRIPAAIRDNLLGFLLEKAD